MNYNEFVNYRLSRAKETLDDEKILAEKSKWNSTINRLYYAAFYAASALLLNSNMNPTTHSGTKLKFLELFIKTEIIPVKYGKMYIQLFQWRQKGDYDDLFDFDREKTEPYFEPVHEFIILSEKLIAESK